MSRGWQRARRSWKESKRDFYYVGSFHNFSLFSSSANANSVDYILTTEKSDCVTLELHFFQFYYLNIIFMESGYVAPSKQMISLLFSSNFSPKQANNARNLLYRFSFKTFKARSSSCRVNKFDWSSFVAFVLVSRFS